MAQRIPKKSYLHKYVSGSSGDSNKKKKKVAKGKGLKIFDDDIDITKIRNISGDELDILDQGEDAPQIAGIIDDRPEELKMMDKGNTTSKWRVISKDDGFNSQIEIEEIKKTIKETEKDNEVVFGKMYSDSEDNNDSDLSPPRKSLSVQVSQQERNTHKQIQTEEQIVKDTSKVKVNKPKREYASMKLSENIERPKAYDSDASPPRKRITDTRSKSRTTSRWDKDEPTTVTASQTKKLKKKRSKHSRAVGSQSPTVDTKVTQTSRYNSVGTQSAKLQTQRDTSTSPPNHKPRLNTPSPKPKRRDESEKRKSPPAKKVSDTKKRDSKLKSQRLPRRDSQEGPNVSPPPKRRVAESDSDPSPVRRIQNPSRLPRIAEDASPSGRTRRKDRPDDSNLGKMQRTLEGKLAGLQDATQLRKENEQFRRRENDMFHKMNDETSGRNAQTVSRKKDKVDTEADKEKVDRQKMLDELYKKWNKGVKQVEAQTARIQAFIHEAGKPLARHVGDADLESSLRRVERDGDPMLDYMRDKKKERGELPPERPRYKGKYMPNRFNIPPGYRWDGIDRSNGYEKKYFENQSNKKAQDEDYYKWASADL